MRRLIVLLVVVGVLGGAAYFVQANAQARQKQKPNIRQATIDRGDLTLSVNATGAIAPVQTAKLSFDNPGLVTEIAVQEGQHVAMGDLLARQDDQAFRLGVIQAEAALKVAQLQLEQLQAPPTEQDLAVPQANLKAAQAAYNSLAGSIDPNAVQQAQLRYQQAQTAYQDAIQYRRDMGGQYKTDSPQYQLALAQEGQASFAVEAARLQVELLRKGVDSRVLTAAKEKIKVAQAELDRAKAGPPQIQLDRATLAVQQAQTALDQARQQQVATVLSAPFAGEVSLIGIKVGTLSVNTVPAIVLTDTSQMHVTVKVDEIDIGQVHEKQPVTFTLDALPGETLSGHISQISLTANQAVGTVVTYEVQVTLDPTKARIKAGMTASASITVRQLHDVLRVPNLFVRLDRRNNQAYVNLVGADGKLTEVPVTLGLRTEEYSEVLGGLNEGDAVGINLDTNFSLFGN